MGHELSFSLLVFLPIVVQGAPASAIVVLLLRGVLLFTVLQVGRKCLQEENERAGRREERSLLVVVGVDLAFARRECERFRAVRGEFFPPSLSPSPLTTLFFFHLRSTSPSSPFSISLWEPGPLKTPVEDQTTHQQQCLTRKCFQSARRERKEGGGAAASMRSKEPPPPPSKRSPVFLLPRLPPRAFHAALGRPAPARRRAYH